MWKQTTLKLTIMYSLIFIGFLTLFSGGLYVWVNSALGEGYVEQVRGQVEQTDKIESVAQQNQTVQVAADIALDHFRNILLAVDAIGVILVPLGAYALTRRTLWPLIQSQEQQKQFIANASHELRTPLAILNGELELALRKPQSITKYQKTITASKQEVDHMTHLTKELLLLAQLDETSAGLPEMTTINLHELLQDIKRQLVPKIEAHSITMRINCPHPLTVAGSPTLLTVAIGNVVDNAIRHSPLSGEVSISVLSAQDHIIITVSDHGQGIPIPQQAHLFDRFYQAQSSRSGEGFGLGLAITKKIITLHGGKISFTSSASGTAFQIVI